MAIDEERKRKLREKLGIKTTKTNKIDEQRKIALKTKLGIIKQQAEPQQTTSIQSKIPTPQPTPKYTKGVQDFNKTIGLTQQKPATNLVDTQKQIRQQPQQPKGISLEQAQTQVRQGVGIPQSKEKPFYQQKPSLLAEQVSKQPIPTIAGLGRGIVGNLQGVANVPRMESNIQKERQSTLFPQPKNLYEPISQPYNVLKDIGNKIDKYIYDKYGDTAITRNVYNFASTIGNMLPSIALTIANAPLGTASFVGSSIGQYGEQAESKGYSPSKSAEYGIIMGSLEGLTEAIPLGRMAKAFKVGRTLGELGTDALVNAGQESTMALAQMIGNKTILDEKVDWAKLPQNMVQDGLMGALVSTVIGGSLSGINSATKVYDKIQTNKQVTEQELKNTLSDIKKQTGITPEKVFVQNIKDNAVEFEKQIIDLAKSKEATDKILDVKNLIPNELQGKINSEGNYTISDVKTGTNIVTEPTKQEAVAKLQEGLKDKTVKKQVINKLEQAPQITETTIGKSQTVEKTQEQNVQKASKTPMPETKQFVEQRIKQIPKEKQVALKEPVKRSEIQKIVQEFLKIPVAQGKFRERAYGIFKVREEVIRLSKAKDLDTLFHEMGHKFDKDLVLNNRGAVDELMKLGKVTSSKNYTKIQVLKEGVAEFFRNYIIQPEIVKESTPEFYSVIENIRKKDNKFDKFINQITELTDKYIKQPSEQRIASNISMNPTKKQLPKTKEIYNKFYASWIDSLKPIDNAVKQVTQGAELNITKDPYKQAWLSKGWQGKAESMLKLGITNVNTGEKIGKSFEEIISQIPDGELENFITYITSIRAKELSGRLIQTGLRDEDINSVILKYKDNKVYNKAFKELIEYQDNLLKQLKDSGLYNSKELNTIKQLNQYYIPFYRVVDTTAKGMGKGQEAFKTIKSIKGSTRDIINPLESIVKNTYVIANMIDRQNVSKALFIELPKEFEKTGQLFDKVPPDMIPTTFKLQDIKKALLEASDDIFYTGKGESSEAIEHLDLDTVASLFRPKTFYSDKDRIITAFNDGKPEYYQVHDEELYRAFKSLDQESSNILIKILNVPSKILRAGATAFNVEFAPTNLFRDTISAGLYSKYGFIPVVDTLKGIFTVATAKTGALKKISPELQKKADDLYRLYLSSGSAQANFVSMDRNYMNKNLNEIVRDKLKKESIIDKAKFYASVYNPYELLLAVNEFAESGTRVGEFQKAFNKELKRGRTIKEASQLAGLSSRDVTLDFLRSGNLGKLVNMVEAFFNTTIQSNDKFVREYKKRPVELTIKSIIGITLPSILLHLLYKDDEDYKAIPQWQKDMFTIIKIPLPNGEHIWVKMPQISIAGFMFSALPKRAIDYIVDADPEAFKDVIPQALSEVGISWSKLPISNIVRTIVELGSNYSFFRQSPIVPYYEEEYKKPSERYGTNTPETAKGIGKLLNVSPRKVEYAFTGFGGGVGKQILELSDTVLNLITNNQKVEKGLDGVPIIRKFVTNPIYNNKYLQDFYTKKKKLQQEQPDSQESKNLNSISKKMATIRDEIEQLSLVPTKDAKKQIDILQRKINSLAEFSLGKKTALGENTITYGLDLANKNELLKYYDKTKDATIFPNLYEKKFTHEKKEITLTDVQYKKYLEYVNKYLKHDLKHIKSTDTNEEIIEKIKNAITNAKTKAKKKVIK